MAKVSSGVEKQRVNIYLPKELVERCDEEAKSTGLSRQSIIAMRLTQYYEAVDREKTVNEGIKLLTGMSADEFTNVLLQKVVNGEKWK